MIFIIKVNKHDNNLYCYNYNNSRIINNKQPNQNFLSHKPRAIQISVSRKTVDLYLFLISKFSFLLEETFGVLEIHGHEISPFKK